MEPGLSYLITPLRNKFPHAKIISLHAEEVPVDLAAIPDSSWYPGMDISLNDFLENEIPDCLAGEILLVEWKASRQYYGKKYLYLVEASVEFIKKIDANSRTILAFGHLWVKNYFKNLDLVSNIIQYEVFSKDILVCGAGPSLENSIPAIKEKRKNLFIIAASSSLGCLKTNGINADLVITTDGGNWARLHLFETFRSVTFRSSHDTKLCAALTAALPAQCRELKLLPLTDTSYWQNIILKKLGIPCLSLPQRGTVTASALDLAFKLSRGNIFVSGMDLQNRDIRSHSRPYSFDSLLEEKEKRFNPFYSQIYKRASLIKKGSSYKIYEDWFKKQISLYPGSIYSLGENNPLFAKNKIDVTQYKEQEEAIYSLVKISHKDYLKDKALKIIINELEENEQLLKRELSPLLFPNENEEKLKLKNADFLIKIKEAIEI